MFTSILSRGLGFVLSRLPTKRIVRDVEVSCERCAFGWKSSKELEMSIEAVKNQAGDETVRDHNMEGRVPRNSVLGGDGAIKTLIVRHEEPASAIGTRRGEEVAEIERRYCCEILKASGRCKSKK